MKIALVVSIFFLTVLLVGQLTGLITRRQRLLEKRLKLVLSEPVRTIPKEPNAVGKPSVGWLRSFSLPGSFLGKRYREILQSDLVKAGIPLKAEELVGFCVICALAGMGITYFMFQNIYFTIILGIIGFWAPVIWIKYLKKRRVNRLEGQLLDAIVLMANSLRGGHSFMQALELTSRETMPPLSEEFTKVVRETKVGISVEEALNNLVKRVESKDLELVITGVLVQRKVGGNLAAVLDTVADTIDKRIKMKGKIKTLTAQGKLTAWIVSILPFALGAMIFGKYPEFGRIMVEELIGMVMLSSGLIMLVLGIAVIRKVVNIDV